LHEAKANRKISVVTWAELLAIVFAPRPSRVAGGLCDRKIRARGFVVSVRILRFSSRSAPTAVIPNTHAAQKKQKKDG
jgi:hypothetical protein